MVREFHIRNKYVSYTKAQIQEKEGQLKRDYKMLKEARNQSGSSWNYERSMVESPPALLDNLVVTFPKIKKFCNNEANFPLYDTLGELYDDHLAEGTYNFTSMESPEDLEQPHRQVIDVQANEKMDDAMVHDIPDSKDDVTNGRDERRAESAIERDDAEDLDDIREVAAVERSGQRETTNASRNQQRKDKKRSTRGSRIEDMMERFLDTREEEGKRLAKQAEEEGKRLAKQEEEEAARRAKEAEEEAARRAKEKEAAKGNDFSIKRCVAVVKTVGLTKEEKAKAMDVFIKRKENIEAFICGCEADV